MSWGGRVKAAELRQQSQGNGAEVAEPGRPSQGRRVAEAGRQICVEAVARALEPG